MLCRCAMQGVVGGWQGVGPVDRFAPLDGRRESRIEQGYKEDGRPGWWAPILGALGGFGSNENAGAESRTSHSGSSLVATP